jgi:hypothetical protein
MTTRRRGTPREDGTASLELVGLMPLVAVVASLALQDAAVVFVAHATDDAARQAARAVSLGRDAKSAARGAVPSGLEVQVTSEGSGRVTVRVEVPRLSPLPQPTVTRSAVMPDTTGMLP